jgi:hypothetical protein
MNYVSRSVLEDTKSCLFVAFSRDVPNEASKWIGKKEMASGDVTNWGNARNLERKWRRRTGVKKERSTL